MFSCRFSCSVPCVSNGEECPNITLSMLLSLSALPVRDFLVITSVMCVFPEIDATARKHARLASRSFTCANAKDYSINCFVSFHNS